MKAPEKPLISCHECGLFVRFPRPNVGESAHCPRCKHTLFKEVESPHQRLVAYAIACLVMLVLSLLFPFMSFSVQGLSQQISLLNTVEMLDQFQNLPLAALLLLSIVILPALFVSIAIYLYLLAAKHATQPVSNPQRLRVVALCKLALRIEPWLMVDVFLIGILVSLVKIASMAEIGMGNSFWAFCAYALLMVKCMTLIDRSWLLAQFIEPQVVKAQPGQTHQNSDYHGCHLCFQVNHKRNKHCCRCSAAMHQYDLQRNLQNSWALLFTAMVFYLPANLYPIMYTVSLGESLPSTILGGVVLLWHYKSYPIAAIIFTASVFIPIAKMIALAWLYITAGKVLNHPQSESIKLQKIYRITEFIGRWSMIDVFVVAILVALIQLNNLMAVFPGPAALSFAAVVIFTMLSAMNFDSRSLWPAPKTGTSSYCPTLEPKHE